MAINQDKTVIRGLRRNHLKDVERDILDPETKYDIICYLYAANGANFSQDPAVWCTKIDTASVNMAAPKKGNTPADAETIDEDRMILKGGGGAVGGTYKLDRLE